jgi:hypothetical protein
VADIFVGKTFTLKNMAEMATAIGTDNFHSPTVGIRLTAHRVVNLIIKTWPAAM